MCPFDDATIKPFNPNHLRFSLALKYFDESLSTLLSVGAGHVGAAEACSPRRSIGKLERL